MRPDLTLLDQSGSGCGVKFYATSLVWSTFYDQKNTTRVGLYTKQITRKDNYVVATAASILQVI